MNLDGAKRAPHDWWRFESPGDRRRPVGHVVVNGTLAGTADAELSGAFLRALVGDHREAA